MPHTSEYYETEIERLQQELEWERREVNRLNELADKLSSDLLDERLKHSDTKFELEYAKQYMQSNIKID
jgi:hypothetical protein